MSTGQTDESKQSSSFSHRYTREDLLSLCTPSEAPTCYSAPDFLLVQFQLPCLHPAQSFTHSLGADLNSRPNVKEKRPEGMPDWHRGKAQKAVYFHPAQAATLSPLPKKEVRPLRIVLSTGSRNVPSDLQLPDTALVRCDAIDNGDPHPKLNPDAQPWQSSFMDPRLPRYHVALLQEKTQRGDPFSSILLESGIVDQAGFVSLPSNSRASERTWYYRDPQGLVQGPFSSVEMFNWNAAGYFPVDLLVASASKTGFRPLAAYVKRGLVV